MKITVISLFPNIIEEYFSTSIMKRAIASSIIEYEVVNIRNFAFDKYHSCDDEPYGGGYGMLLKAEPLALALDSCGSPKVHTVFPTPSAPLFCQEDAQNLALKDEIIFICGRYEGIDERIRDKYVTEAFSIGEYVLSSGEIASLTIIDCVYRLVDGVIRKESLNEESYNGGLLEYPQYTRPAEFRGLKVPDVLLSGNHQAIKEWRIEQSKIRTEKYKNCKRNK